MALGPTQHRWGPQDHGFHSVCPWTDGLPLLSKLFLPCSCGVLILIPSQCLEHLNACPSQVWHSEVRWSRIQSHPSASWSPYRTRQGSQPAGEQLLGHVQTSGWVWAEPKEKPRRVTHHSQVEERSSRGLRYPIWNPWLEHSMAMYSELGRTEVATHTNVLGMVYQHGLKGGNRVR